MDALRNNWRAYVAEATGLGVFMISACVFSVLLFGPTALPMPNMQTGLFVMGGAMGATAIAILKSPFGKLSGAHINPAVTLTFWRLGKIRGVDAAFYMLFQFIGAFAGVAGSHLALGDGLAAVSFAATVPDGSGPLVSFAAECAISFGMMMTVLAVSNHSRLAAFTPFAAGALVAIFIAFESPVSGMSMNPARTFGSAIVGGIWTNWWVYFAAPPLGMLAAGELFVRLRGAGAVVCAKLDHDSSYRCIFDCNAR
ncbi:MAG: aquaporin [Acidobacteria bacterium]|nr:aquaporin [Acidobacteriota bacterium]